MAPDIEGQVAKKIVKPVHARLVSSRRVMVLARLIASMIPESLELSGLDIGCGTGEIGRIIESLRPQTGFTGVDVMARSDAVIPVTKFDGEKLPFENASFDFATIIDVLHHTNDPHVLLNESMRVARRFVLIKDHICKSFLDDVLLRFMDWFGNRAYDIHLPYNYLSEQKWQKLYQECNVIVRDEITRLSLYPPLFSYLFDRHLHFIAKLMKQ